MGVKILLRKPHLEINLFLYGFLARGGKGHVDAAQRHPVNVAHPVSLSPPSKTVAKCALIQVIPEYFVLVGK